MKATAVRGSDLRALPAFVPPMLCSGGELPAEAGEWAFEVKWDGIRAQVRVDAGAVVVRSRPGRDCTHEFPELARLAGALQARGALLDGELVCLGESGRPDFARVRGRLGRRDPVAIADACRRTPATFVAFDLLHLDEAAVRTRPYRERRELLEEVLAPGPAWQVPEAFSDGPALAAATRAQSLEGIVAKRLDAPYRSGARDRAWVKVKHRRLERLVICGYRAASDGRLEGIAVARPDDGELRFAGVVELGLANAACADLLAALATLDRASGPRVRRPAGELRWVEPRLGATVSCHGEPAGRVRDAVLRGVELLEDR